MTSINITLRGTDAKDSLFLADCFLRSMRESITACRGQWDEGRERVQFEQQLDLSGTKIIQVGGVDVGFMMIVRQSDALQIHSLCIAPEYQGRGIGSSVTMDVVEQGRDSGREVVLSVLKVNREAKALYERLGFSIIGESDHHHHMRYERVSS